jgi:hypothetical protein
MLEREEYIREMPLVIIESPFAGDVDSNIKFQGLVCEIHSIVEKLHLHLICFIHKREL